MMQRLFSTLLSRGLLGFTGVGVVAVLIWYEGPIIQFGDFAPLKSEVNRFILIAVIIVGFGLYKLFMSWRDKKKNNAISDDLAASGEGADPNAAQ